MEDGKAEEMRAKRWLPAASLLTSPAMPSIFTKIIKREIPSQFVFEDDLFVSILDIAPTNPGHVLLIPRQEAQFLGQLSGRTLERLGSTLVRLIAAVKTATGCPAVNVLVNDGPEANQAIPHAHIHLIPRFAGDGKFTHPSGTPYQGNEMAAIAEKLRTAWNG